MVVEAWFLKLCASDADTAALVERAIDRLAAGGPTLGRPLVIVRLRWRRAG